MRCKFFRGVNKITTLDVDQITKAPSWLVSLTRGVVARLNRANELVKKNGLVDESLSQMTKDLEKIR